MESPAVTVHNAPTPREPGEPGPGKEGPLAGRREPRSIPVHHGPRARRYSVVVVDDSSGMRRLVRTILEGSGRLQVVAEASDGNEAIERCREHRPDVVILDLQMPRLDGLCALPLILEASPASRVVVLSTRSRAEAEADTHRAGATLYLEKGLEPAAFLKAVLGVVTSGPPRPPRPPPGRTSSGRAGPMRPADR